MNVIQLTSDELAALVAAVVAKALEGVLPWVLEMPVEVERHPRSRKAVNQARYRQRLKEKSLPAATEMVTLATETATTAATPVTLASAMLATDVATSATAMATSATQTATAVTLEVAPDMAPLPPAPSHPLPPQTPPSPAHPHPPTPVPISREGEVGDWVHFTADAGKITEADHAQLQPQSQAQHMAVNPGHGTCAVQTIAGPNDMSGKVSAAGMATGTGASAGTSTAIGSGTTGGIRAPRERRPRRRDKPGRQRRERPPRDPEVKRLPRCEHALRLAAIFKRPATTEWSPNETKELRRTGKIEEEDLQVLEKYYAAHYPPEAKRNPLRHDLVTLLENLRGEVDRARRWDLKNRPPAPGGAKRGFWAGTVLEGRVD